MVLLNVRKLEAPGNIRDFYQALLKMAWEKFCALTFIFTVSLNFLSALIYLLIVDEIVVGSKFKPASRVNDPGELIHSP